MASEWQTAFVVSRKMQLRALLTAVKNYNKSLEKLQDFFFKTETIRPRPNVQDQDFMIQDKEQDQDFHFCLRAASRPRPWSRGLLHHWLKFQKPKKPKIYFYGLKT